jgi:hypothetical protein
VVPTHVDLLPSTGYFLISFAKAFACFLYTLFVAAYLFEEQPAKKKARMKRKLVLVFMFFEVKIKVNV